MHHFDFQQNSTILDKKENIDKVFEGWSNHFCRGRIHYGDSFVLVGGTKYEYTIYMHVFCTKVG